MKILEVWEKHKDSDPILHKVKVDDDDYEYLKTYEWVWRDGYAAMKTGRKYYQLHRMVMGVLFKEPIIVDHKDNDHENCQKVNLRRADRFQNQQNRLTNKNNTLPKGIRQLPSGKYNVRVQGWRKRYVFGAFNTVEEAVEARNQFSKELHGEFYRPSHLLDTQE
jgi:hypothetical protein